MTVFDNMAYGLKMRGMKKDIIHQRVKSVAKMLQLDDYLQRKPIMLSGGQRQRVAMGRAVVRSPAVFLFDEPLSNLDSKLRTEMRHEIKKLHKELNTTCLYVTHDQTEAMTLADRVVVLNRGRVEQVGTPRELYQYPATVFVAGFIGHYSMNFLPAILDLKQQVVITSTGNTLPLPQLNAPIACGGPVLVGIRPEHLYVTETLGFKSISGHIDFIDDMGADKLVQMSSNGVQLSVRVAGDVHLTDNALLLDMELGKASLFCQQTGKRLGGWNE
jgi:sn-glycerol 3-phosphate transport system ATP-binding protein